MIDEILNENIIERDFYLEKLKRYIWSPVIKVIIGQRRVGKSYILKNIIQFLVKNKSFKKENIFYINKELPKFDNIKTYEDLKKVFKEFSKNKKNDKIFIGIDEIQQIKGWEKFINGILAQYKNEIEIFITWSNSFLLSSELSTYIAGRYIEFFISPLTFDEFCKFKNSSRDKQNFLEYLKYWWLPGIFKMEYSDETIFNYLKSIYNTIVLKDIVSHFNIKNLEFFENLYKYILGNIWNTFSAKNIASYLKNQQIRISVDSVLNYLYYWEQTFILNKVKSVDPKTKKFFEIYNKYYVSDLWIRNSLVWLNFANGISWILENYVFIVLKKYSYNIKIWRLKNHKEIDFIAEKNGKTIYIQVCSSLLNENTLKREYEPFGFIKDNWPKYVISFDDIDFGEKNWIKHINIIDFEWIV